MNIRTAILAAGLILYAAGIGTAASGGQDESPRNSPVVKVVKEWSPSVVNISTERIVLLKQQPYWQAYGGAFEEFFKQYAQQTVSATQKSATAALVRLKDVAKVELSQQTFATFSGVSGRKAAPKRAKRRRAVAR